MKPAFLLSPDETLKTLKTDPAKGLAPEEAARRLAAHGPNVLVQKELRGAWEILAEQFKSVLVLILILAAVVSFFLHEPVDAAVIFVIVVLNAALGFWQESKAESAMAALKQLAAPNVRVVRGGREREIPARDLVPGDVVLLEAGNRVAADCRILESSNLRAMEAALTGESEAVEKRAETLDDPEAPVGDRRNMLHLGTSITYGRARAAVVETGMATELGKIAGMLHGVEEEAAPLQKRLARLGRHLAAAALVLVAVVAVLSLARGAALKETFMTAVSMAVAAVPEGLAAVVTIALALGARRMLRRKALIRHLPAVETLGSVTTICSDKTGTLTQNRMTLVALHPFGGGAAVEEVLADGFDGAAQKLLVAAGALCNDAVLQPGEEGEDPEVLGDPTEGALVHAAKRFAMDKEALEQALPRVEEIPFESDRKRMTTVHRPAEGAPGPLGEALETLRRVEPGPYLAFTKGAADGMLDVATRLLNGETLEPMSAERRRAIEATNADLAGRGMRVLAMACRALSEADLDDPAGWEQDLVYLGLVALIDPVRPEAVDAVATCRRAGVRVVMITGDHPLTARAIARELGFDVREEPLTGREIERLSEAELRERIRRASVCARVSPEHKMRLIDALQANGEIVSMTGDGVNDAPALKSADIGVAMGITGSDVAKESSDMILLDDNFATIVAAVGEGRTIFDNIKKFVRYILTGNVGEIAAMLVGPLVGMPIPLLPTQILWINLMTDGAPAVAMGYEEAEDDVMRRPPARPGEGVFAEGGGWSILLMGALVGLVSLSVGRVLWLADPEGPWRTAVFTTLTFCQMVYAFCVRKSRRSLFTASPLGNRVLAAAVAGTFVLQLALVYVPFLQTLFKTDALGAGQLGLCVLAALAVIPAAEVEKALRRRGARRRAACSRD